MGMGFRTGFDFIKIREKLGDGDEPGSEEGSEYEKKGDVRGKTGICRVPGPCTGTWGAPVGRKVIL